MKVSYIVFTFHISIHISKYNYNIKINYPLLHNIQRYTQQLFLFDRTVEEAQKVPRKANKGCRLPSDSSSKSIKFKYDSIKL